MVYFSPLIYLLSRLPFSGEETLPAPPPAVYFPPGRVPIFLGRERHILEFCMVISLDPSLVLSLVPSVLGTRENKQFEGRWCVLYSFGFPWIS